MFPKLQGSVENQIGQLLKWQDNAIKFVRWSSDDIILNFADRSVEELLTQGEVGYMNPCTDLVSLAVATFNYNKIEPCLVLEEIKVPWRKDPVAHFAIEFDDHYLDYFSKKQVHLGKGDYKSAVKGVELITLKKFNVSNFNISLPIYKNLNFETRDAFVKSLKHFDFYAHLNKLKLDNTDETWQAYKLSLDPVKDPSEVPFSLGILY